MKKLYRRGGTPVYPSPPQPLVCDNSLSFLPAAILTLAAALTPEDKEVLSYLLSCSTVTLSSHHRKSEAKSDHRSALSSCGCFGCYTGYWIRWDASPNRQLIHEIIESFEDSTLKNKQPKGRKERRKRCLVADLESSPRSVINEPQSSSEEAICSPGAGGEADDGEEQQEITERGSVRKLMSLIGERIWNVWGQ